jgi:hypothetical protein
VEINELAILDASKKIAYDIDREFDCSQRIAAGIIFARIAKGEASPCLMQLYLSIRSSQRTRLLSVMCNVGVNFARSDSPESDTFLQDMVDCLRKDSIGDLSEFLRNVQTPKSVSHMEQSLIDVTLPRCVRKWLIEDLRDIGRLESIAVLETVADRFPKKTASLARNAISHIRSRVEKRVLFAKQLSPFFEVDE